MKPVFTPTFLEAFRMILTAVPAAKVVFSTTCRLPPHVNRLHEQWLLHGFPPSLAIGGTPDLRGEGRKPVRQVTDWPQLPEDPQPWERDEQAKLDADLETHLSQKPNCESTFRSEHRHRPLPILCFPTKEKPSHSCICTLK